MRTFIELSYNKSRWFQLRQTAQGLKIGHFLVVLLMSKWSSCMATLFLFGEAIVLKLWLFSSVNVKARKFESFQTFSIVYDSAFFKLQLHHFTERYWKCYEARKNCSVFLVFKKLLHAVVYVRIHCLIRHWKKVPNFIEVISNFHRFRHPSSLGSAFKSWIKLHSIKAATTFNNVGKLVICTLLLLKWSGSCSVQIYAKVWNFFFNLKICQEFDDILLHR